MAQVGSREIREHRLASEARGRRVRQALENLSMSERLTVEEHQTMGKLARIASDETLAALGLMLAT